MLPAPMHSFLISLAATRVPVSSGGPGDVVQARMILDSGAPQPQALVWLEWSELGPGLRHSFIFEQVKQI